MDEDIDTFLRLLSHSLGVFLELSVVAPILYGLFQLFQPSEKDA